MADKRDGNPLMNRFLLPLIIAILAGIVILYLEHNTRLFGGLPEPPSPPAPAEILPTSSPQGTKSEPTSPATSEEHCLMLEPSKLRFFMSPGEKASHGLHIEDACGGMQPVPYQFGTKSTFIEFDGYGTANPTVVVSAEGLAPGTYDGNIVVSVPEWGETESARQEISVEVNIVETKLPEESPLPPEDAYPMVLYSNDFTDLEGWIPKLGLFTHRCGSPMLQSGSVIYTAGGNRASYVELPNPIVTDASLPLIVEVRFRYSGNGGIYIGLQKNDEHICQFFESPGVAFAANGEGDFYYLILTDQKGAAEISAPAVHDGKWHIARMVRDESGYWSLYIDGDLLGTGSTRDLNANYRFLSVEAYGAASPGEFDDISVRSGENLSQGLISCFTFDGNTADAAGNADGIPHGSPDFVAERKLGTHAISLNSGATTDWIEVPQPPPAPARDLTYAAWIYARAAEVVGKHEIFSSWYADNEDAFRMYPESGRMTIAIEPGWSAYLTWLLQSNSPIVNERWYHVVGVKSGNSLRLYINGTLDSQKTLSGTPTTAASRFAIGTNPNLPNNERYDGLVDDAAVWSRALSEAEITRLYNGGAGMTCSALP